MLDNVPAWRNRTTNVWVDTSGNVLPDAATVTGAAAQQRIQQLQSEAQTPQPQSFASEVVSSVVQAVESIVEPTPSTPPAQFVAAPVTHTAAVAQQAAPAQYQAPAPVQTPYYETDWYTKLPPLPTPSSGTKTLLYVAGGAAVLGLLWLLVRRR